jgi:hypothetical protein
MERLISYPDRNADAFNEILKVVSFPKTPEALEAVFNSTIDLC